VVLDESISGMSNTLLWFFLSDLFHQLLFYFGGVVAMLILLWEKWRKTSVNWKWAGAFFLFCLFVSCFQAFVDEHHNSQQLIQEKSDLAGQMNFWKGQSYAKDADLRSRDQLLGLNFHTLTQSQITANATQKSLGVKKMLDLTSPQFHSTKRCHKKISR
jgi:hypothetical protein